ncbi:MAG: zinc-ribbon domain-containing protein [Thermoplasmata archaeon]|jgi:hypothetical protein
MTYAERLEKLAPNLTSRQREILARKRLIGVIIAFVGLSLIVVGVVVYGAASGFGPIPARSIIGFVVLMVIGLVVIWVGFSQLQEGALILRGAMATSHPDDSFTDSDAMRLYSRTKVAGTRPAPPPGHPDATTRYCPYCGVQNSQDHSFCRKCGEPLPPPL